MFITLEDLDRYQACENGKRFIRRFHPDGFEMSELVLDHHVPKTFIHWARNNLPCTDEEKKLYDKRMKIINSENYHCSHNLTNTSCIKYSWDIQDSKHVFNSEFVKNSQNIVKSEQVESSCEIYFSEFVNDSKKIYFGKNISSSENVTYSQSIAEGKNINKSTNVIQSSEIINCQNVTNSFFCMNCNNIQNCLFCYGLTDQSYCIFNQPVDKARFELFVTQYKKLIDNALFVLCQKWPPKELLVIQEPKANHQAFYCKQIPERVWKWAKLLPGYDKTLLYKITMLPEILVD